jgi:hypothetical protein
MAFPDTYRFEHGSRRDKIKMIGNGVCPPVMSAVIETLTRAQNTITRRVAAPRGDPDHGQLSISSLESRCFGPKPQFAAAARTRARYYVSQAVLQNKLQGAGSIGRVPGPEIEAFVIAALRNHLNARGTASRCPMMIGRLPEARKRSWPTTVPRRACSTRRSVTG